MFLIASSRAMRASHSTGERLNFLFGVFLCSGILMAPLALIDPVVPTLNDWVFLVLLGVFPTALGVAGAAMIVLAVFLTSNEKTA